MGSPTLPGLLRSRRSQFRTHIQNRHPLSTRQIHGVSTNVFRSPAPGPIPSYSFERPMGTSASKGVEGTSTSERFFGLQNFHNTCYANSVIQMLYWCEPFRVALIEYHARNRSAHTDTILSCLADLFEEIATHSRQSGVVAPK